jgi:hypothetical protein
VQILLLSVVQEVPVAAVPELQEQELDTHALLLKW